ncbi:zinc finger protein 16-like [Scomber scombrus]|uniref:Zinc finger protein 16-like n=1 Tax=Scomber scombrus TaxID=13677 RepID=A0AAV1PKN4_SCOSC
MEQLVTNHKKILKDPVGTRAKHAQVQAASRQRKIEEDPVGARAKHAQVQAARATRQKFLLTFQDAPFQQASSFTSVVIYQSQNGESLTNNVTAQQSTDSVFLNCNSESVKQEEIEMWPENIVECVVGEDYKDIDMKSPHETSLESTDDSTSSDTDEDEMCSIPVDVSPKDPKWKSTDDSTSLDTDEDEICSKHVDVSLKDPEMKSIDDSTSSDTDEDEMCSISVDVSSKDSERSSTDDSTSSDTDEDELCSISVDVSPKDPEPKSTDDSTSSDSDDENGTFSKPDDPEYGLESDSSSDSSATDGSSDSSNNPHSKKIPATLNTICYGCGRGPFRRLGVHLRHCRGKRKEYECTLCKMLFKSDLSLKHHYMSLFSCDICNQVFYHEYEYDDHQCPKGSNLSFYFFCHYSMPKKCSKCNFLFTCKKTLLNHVARDHKLGIVANPSELTNEKVPMGDAAIQSTTSMSGYVRVYNAATCQNTNPAGQTCTGSLSTAVKSASTGKPSAQLCIISPAPPVRSGEPPPNALLFFPPGDTDKPPATPVSPPVSPPALTTMALFENNSRNMALMKGMSKDWRSKAPHPCRECGAILRQPSLIISHRYLHRGRRSHRCQCGRAFRRRLHLLRHCVQHAEAMSYICASCGESFSGARQLAEHMNGKSGKKSSTSGKCKMPFKCDCGQLFFRPSAYIWHQLKNKTKTKQWKKNLK